MTAAVAQALPSAGLHRIRLIVTAALRHHGPEPTALNRQSAHFDLAALKIILLGSSAEYGSSPGFDLSRLLCDIHGHTYEADDYPPLLLCVSTVVPEPSTSVTMTSYPRVGWLMISYLDPASAFLSRRTCSRTTLVAIGCSMSRRIMVTDGVCPRPTVPAT